MKLRNLLLTLMVMLVSGVVSAQTAVTPAAGTANPFAYALSSTVEDGVITINYSLNTDAEGVEVIVKNSAGDAVITQALEGKTKGAHTATIDLVGQETDTYTWEVKVTGAAKTAVQEFQNLSFYHPSGLDVDNSMESPSFGTLFIAEGYTNGKTSGYVSAQADGSDGGGLYMYTAGGEQILNKDGKARFSFRYIVKAGYETSFLFTNVMGLDLTNPQNVAPANTFVQVDEADEIYCGEQTSFPEASVNDYFGCARVGDFTGTVNVYKGKRAFEGAYGSYGAPASVADDEGLTLVASTVAYSSGYTFTEEGFYTLEYVQGDKIAYKTVNVVYDPIATANKIGDVSVNDLIGNFKSNNSTLTLAQGSATTPGSNVTFSGLKMNVTKNTADETLPVVVNYDKVVNLKGFSYANRKVNVPLIGLVPIPATAMVGTMPENNSERDAAIAAGTLKLNNEFEQIKIVLTDVNDETNKLEIIIGSSNTKEGSADGPCTDGKTYYNSQFSVIGYKGTDRTNSTVYTKGHGVKYGAPRQFSYLGYQQEATNVIYDYEKNAVFTNVDGNKNSGISDSYLLKYLGVPAAEYGSIADPDNGGYYKACDEAAHQGTWDGFSTGEVKLSLEMTLNPEFDSANLMITNLFGLDLTKGQTTVAVNDYSNYVDTEELSEYSPSGELTVPSITLKNAMLANYAGDYEGKVAVKLNGDEIANVDAGSKVNLNKPGVYNFVYDLPGDRTYVLTTKVKTAINLVLNGVGKLSFNGQSIGNGDLIDVYESLSANVKISDDWYFESISFVDGANANVTHNYDNLNLTADIENLPLNGTLTITVRQYYLLNYLVKGNNYESIKVKQGLTAELPSVNPSVTGYNFMGWLLNNEPFTNANLLELTDSYSAEPINLTANLNPIIYTANVKVDEAFTSIATVPSSTGYYTIDSDLGGLGIPAITNSEYEFAGWFVNGKLITKGSDLPCANGETVYACFTIKYYEVTYKNGLDVLSVQKVSLSEKLSAKEFAKEGYRLEGWYVDSNKTQKYEFGKTLTGNLTLYANFVKIESNAQEGSLGSLIDNQGNVVNNASVGAFHNANVGGIITFVLTVIAALGLVAMGVLIILKKTKKETTVNEENE